MDSQFYLQYELSSGELVMLMFQTEDDRDGCHISLDMYKSNLGPLYSTALERMLGKFDGRIVTIHS